MGSSATPSRTCTIQDPGAARRILESCGEDGQVQVIVGYDGPPLPARLDAARLDQLGPGSWRLSAAEGTFEFGARGVETLEPQPRLFDALLAPFALRQRDRTLVGVLLKLLRLPGGVWLLRRWHARRR